MRTHSVFLVTLLALSSPLLVACQHADAANPPQAEREPPSMTVEVLPASRGTLHASITTTTILEAYQEADIAPRVNGIIERVLVDEGDHVSRGQVLAELDKERFEQVVEQANAELRGVEQELARMSEMASRQMVSADAIERLKANRDTLRARLRLAQIDLEATTIRAPFDGVINRRFAKTGNLVQQHHRESLFHIVDLNRLQAVLNIPERDIHEVRVGQSVVLHTNGEPIEAQVARISPAVDRVAGTFRVVVDIDNASNKTAQPLRAGMFARAELRYATRQNTLQIPADSIIQLDGESFVYVVEHDRAQRRRVSTGIRQGQWIEVEDGLEEGQAVIVTGQSQVSDNAPIVAIPRNRTSA